MRHVDLSSKALHVESDVTVSKIEFSSAKKVEKKSVKYTNQFSRNDIFG